MEGTNANGLTWQNSIPRYRRSDNASKSDTVQLSYPDYHSINLYPGVPCPTPLM